MPSDWYDSYHIAYPPLIPDPISSGVSDRDTLYSNRGTHDYSIARGTVKSGGLKNGLRYADAGSGYYDKNENTSESDLGNFGVLELINYLERVGRIWHNAHPFGPRIGLGNISLQYGGPFVLNGTLQHHHHQNGLEIDVRYVRDDDAESGVDISSVYYDFYRTQELVNILVEYAPTGGVTIISADPYLSGITFRADHTDHMHVWIADPDGSNN